MTYIIAIAVAAVAGLLLVWSGLWWALPVVLIALVVYMVRERGEGMATVERTRGPEPTGTPRAASGGADTANERVGQS